MGQLEQTIVIDGTGAILGRLSSFVAKQLMQGKEVVIVNADKIVVSGNPVRLKQYYKQLILGVKSHLSEKWRPKRARSPQRLVEKAVKGMLPKNAKGKEALRRLRVYVGVPASFSKAQLERLPSSMTYEKLNKTKYLTLAEIAKELGWRGEVVA